MQIRTLSMAKIKDQYTVPQYILDHMSGIVWDGFVGDMDDGSQCTKIAAYYDVGGVRYYFIFSRGPHISTEENPTGENYLFRALAAHRRADTKWFGKKYNPSELEQVKLVVDTHDDEAITELKLPETKERNPLNLA